MTDNNDKYDLELLEDLDEINSQLNEMKERIDTLEMRAIHDISSFADHAVACSIIKELGDMNRILNGFERKLFPDKPTGFIRNQFDVFREPGHENDEYPPDLGICTVVSQKMYSIWKEMHNITSSMSISISKTSDGRHPDAFTSAIIDMDSVTK